VDRLAEGYQLALEVANRPEIQAMATVSPPATPKTRAELRQRILDNAYSLPHVIGTCAMGASPDEGSVVDGHGRVHGVDGLAVIDASIIPEATAGFPHLVTLMLAMRLSDELSSQSLSARRLIPQERPSFGSRSA
jgi:choline dehydrogenase